jgi:TolA-binding protein
MKFRILLVSVLSALSSVAQQPSAAGTAPATRYATDAYPGFDSEDEIIRPEKKEPRWFAFINGPAKDVPDEQFAYCRELLAEESFSKACKELDALVREWPTSAEAPAAQILLADTLSERLGEHEDAFAGYRYLLDFYSLSCDYSAIAEKAYKLANVLREEGKSIIWFRFDNTIDVRRAYESLVLRAPGAPFVPQAMLTIGELREAEGRLEQAVQVYENLRNLHPDSKEAVVSIRREADVRMKILREHEYNRARCLDTVRFFESAIKTCAGEDVQHINSLRGEARSLLEDEAYRAAKFYDSRMRTARSAVNAYESFLAEYPQGKHAAEVRERLAELKKGEKK